MSQRHKSSASGSLTPKQIVILIKANKRFCLFLGVLSALIAFTFGLLEVPYYTSTSTIQFKTADVGKTMVANIISDADNLNSKDFIDRSIGVLRSDSFRAELASILKENAAGDRLTLAWAIGKRLRVQYALERLGLGEIKHERINLKQLSTEEIAALLEAMIGAQPDYKLQTADIYITALDPYTAEKVNAVVVRAIIQTNEKIKEADIAKSIEFLEKQRETARRKLAEANDNFRLFYQENPELINVASGAGPANEKSEIRLQKERLTEQLASNKKLLNFYRKKYMEFGKDSDSNAEVFNKFKQELVELKYKRKKYIFQGYDESNEGIIELDKKIADLEKSLTSSEMQGAITDKRLVSVGHEQNISEKIMELQDSIKKEEFELESLSARMGKIAPKSEELSKSLLLLDNLKVDIRLATNLFEEVSKKLEYAQMRKSTEDQQIILKESPSHPVKSNSISIKTRVFFAFLVGLVLAISWLILGMMFSVKITDWQNVEDLGLNFAGILHDFDPDLSEILMHLDCLDRPDAVETPVVLCTSPNVSVPYEDLQLLTSYLARQNEKSLLILVGPAAIHRSYQMVSDIGFAKVYAHANDREFLLQISDKNTIKSLRECIKILEDTYQLKYGCVFLFFMNGINDPNYHIGLKTASKVLLLGYPAKFTAADYYKLLHGFNDLRSTNFAFVEVRKRSQKRRPRSVSPISHDELFVPPRNLSEKVKGIFFDL